MLVDGLKCRQLVLSFLPCSADALGELSCLLTVAQHKLVHGICRFILWTCSVTYYEPCVG